MEQSWKSTSIILFSKDIFVKRISISYKFGSNYVSQDPLSHGENNDGKCSTLKRLSAIKNATNNSHAEQY